MYLFAFLLPGKNCALEARTHFGGRRTGVEMQKVQLSLHALHLEARLSLKALRGIAYSFAPVYSTATFSGTLILLKLAAQLFDIKRVVTSN